MSALKTQNLTMQFGGLKAVSDLSLHIPDKIIFGLIGPNGAGKTTVFNMLTGVYEPTSGTIEAYGVAIQGKKPYEITHRGLARTFQNIRLFKDLSVLDNLLIAIDHHPSQPKHPLLSSLIRTPFVTRNEAERTEKARDLLKFFKLDERADWQAKNLPYGDQRRLEIARAMATGAKLLLLDEPAAGMNPQETASLMETIRELRDRFGFTILLIEHDMRLVMGVCERIAVLDYGVLIAEGTPSEIQRDPKVIEAYLGRPKTEETLHA